MDPNEVTRESPARQGPGRTLFTSALTGALLLSSGCGAAAQPHATAPEEHVVVYASATANEPAPRLAPADVALLRSAAESDDGAAYLLDPAATTVTTLPLAPHRGNGQIEHGPRRGELIEADVQQVADAVAAEAARTGGFDLLAGIDRAARATNAPATLVVVSSGVSTTGPLDLRQVGWSRPPADLARELAGKHLLADLTGWRVVFSGLGLVAGRQQQLGQPQLVAVRSYWLAICAEMHAASCATSDELRADLPSRSTASAPVVAVPQVELAESPKALTWTLPDDAVGFALDSSALGEGADAVLTAIVERVSGLHGSVDVVGHTDPTGTREHNLALSLARARTVADRLVALGLPTSFLHDVRGVAADDDAADAAYTDGRLDETKAAKLRRVVVRLVRHP